MCIRDRSRKWGELQWTRSRTEQPDPFVSAFLTGFSKKGVADILSQELEAKSSRDQKATHGCEDTHKVSVIPKGATGNHLNVSKQRKKDFAEAKSVITGKIERTADGILLVVWDGFANPIVSKVELLAGSRKRFDSVDN